MEGEERMNVGGTRRKAKETCKDGDATGLDALTEQLAADTRDSLLDQGEKLGVAEQHDEWSRTKRREGRKRTVPRPWRGKRRERRKGEASN